jgi:hypothetical protein
VYQHREDGVDSSGEEDRSSDDEEVLEHEPYHRIWVLTCGERAKNVAEDFEEKGDRKGTQVDSPVAGDLIGVQDEGESEKEDGEKGEGERGVIPVDNYWGAGRVLAGYMFVLGSGMELLLRAVWARPVRVDVSVGVTLGRHIWTIGKVFFYFWGLFGV